MKKLNLEGFLAEAGIRTPHSRNMSPYNGKPFECACGEIHQFDDSMDYRNFATNGANAKIIVTCPYNSSVATLIKTKYKFLFMFDGFESLAGHKEE